MNCKFCGCSESTPCHFSAVVEGVRHHYECSWILQGLPICSNPRCVAKAYEEACEVADKAVEVSLQYYPEVAEAWLHR